MVYPAYQLNPGDMFQVDAIKVLTATAAQKKGESNLRLKKMISDNKEKYANFEARYNLLNERISKRKGAYKYDDPMPVELGEAAASAEAAGEEAVSDKAAEDETVGEEAVAKEVSETEAATKNPETLPETPATDKDVEMKKIKLETALIDARFLVRDEKLSEVEKVFRIASFKDRAIHYLGEGSRKLSPSKLIGELVKEMRKLNMLRSQREVGSSGVVAKAMEIDGVNFKTTSHMMQVLGARSLSLPEMKKLGEMIEENTDSAVNDKTPYATPWQPRGWMKPWVFVPRYLEVNHKICAAVYLRHPVARKGQGEVPTPFHYFSNQLAHAWYVTKGVSKYKHKPNA